jgi:hypothetical protein
VYLDLVVGIVNICSRRGITWPCRFPGLQQNMASRNSHAVVDDWLVSRRVTRAGETRPQWHLASGWQCARTCSALQAVRSESDQTADLPARWQILRDGAMTRRLICQHAAPVDRAFGRRLDVAPRQRLRMLGTVSFQEHCNPIAPSYQHSHQQFKRTNVQYYSIFVYTHLAAQRHAVTHCSLLCPLSTKLAWHAAFRSKMGSGGDSSNVLLLLHVYVRLIVYLLLRSTGIGEQWI